MRDCTNPIRACCPYCYQFDHKAVDFPTLISQMWEKGVLMAMCTQNIQMMKAKSRKEDHNINMMLRSGASTGEEKGK